LSSHQRAVGLCSIECRTAPASLALGKETDTPKTDFQWAHLQVLFTKAALEQAVYKLPKKMKK
jgi:hypothetical protein